jgi:hypothetical protein
MMMLLLLMMMIIIIIITKRITHSQSKPPRPKYGETYRGKTKKTLAKIYIRVP